MIRTWSALGIASVLTGAAFAQWTSNPLVNTTVAGGTGDQGTPLIRPTSDGGAWVYFFDNGAGGGYKPVIQRLSSNGTPQFAGNGIVLANRTNTATFVVDMDVDAAGNAIVAFDDNSTGSNNIVVQKILPDGTLAYGAGGLVMPGSSGALGPRIGVCPDGTIVCVWALSNVLTFQRINANGTLVTGANWTLAETGRAQSPSDIIAGATGGEFILLWVRAEGTNVVTSRKGLKIQKWDSSNSAVWNAGTALDVYVSSAAPQQGIQTAYFPALVSDSQGGAVVAWYDIGGTRNAWVQHVLSNGTFKFAPNGLAASITPSATEYRLSASVAYDPASGTYTMGYERSNPLQSQFSMAVQRLDTNGTALWNPAGREIVPYSGNHISFINAIPAPCEHTSLVWIQYTGANGPMEIRATKLDGAGTQPWGAGTLGVSTASTDKGRLSAIKAAGTEMLIACFNSGSSGAADVLAQNITPKGALGTFGACPADLDNDGELGTGLVPDDAVNVNDLLAFLAAFEAGSLGADLDDGSGLGTRDCGVEISDLLFFLAHFEGGC